MNGMLENGNGKPNLNLDKYHLFPHQFKNWNLTCSENSKVFFFSLKYPRINLRITLPILLYCHENHLVMEICVLIGKHVNSLKNLKKSFKNKLKIYNICVCICSSVHVWRSDETKELVLLPPFSLRYSTQVLGLGSKNLYSSEPFQQPLLTLKMIVWMLVWEKA